MYRLTLSVILAALTGSVLAADVSGDLERCRAIEDQDQRLACFDQVSRPEAVAPEPTAASDVADVIAEDPVPVPAAEDAAAPLADPAETTVWSSSAASGSSATGATEDEFGLENRRVEEGAKEIRSRYQGQFSGWGGDTLFPLENGQVWKQIETGRYSYKANRPMLVIKRGMFNSFYLKVDGKNRTVRVKRVR